MPFAVCSFQHFDLEVSEGDELADDHPMVALRPDLFSTDPPKPASRAKQPKE